MGNKKLHISAEGKLLIDEISSVLDFSRPDTLCFAIAKGISMSTGPAFIETFDLKNKWELGENVIDGQNYLLFKHLIIQEQQKIMNEDEISKYMAHYIELGVRKLNEIKKDKASIENLRLLLLEK